MAAKARSELLTQTKHYSTRIDFELSGELARRLEEIVARGLVGSKSEAVRQALLEYFNKLDAAELQRSRLKLLQENGTAIDA
jgi:Arc/MetJ-type ribon-helix-helix transcriptional regulator